jgi:hypothetical protein
VKKEAMDDVHGRQWKEEEFVNDLDRKDKMKVVHWINLDLG